MVPFPIWSNMFSCWNDSTKSNLDIFLYFPSLSRLFNSPFSDSLPYVSSYSTNNSYVGLVAAVVVIMFFRFPLFSCLQWALCFLGWPWTGRTTRHSRIFFNPLWSEIEAKTRFQSSWITMLQTWFVSPVASLSLITGQFSRINDPLGVR